MQHTLHGNGHDKNTLKRKEYNSKIKSKAVIYYYARRFNFIGIDLERRVLRKIQDIQTLQRWKMCTWLQLELEEANCTAV